MSLRNRTKTKLNIEVDNRLLAHAEEYNIDLSNLIHEALKKEVARRWNDENADAVKHYRERVEKDGLWSDKFRRF
jgi:post-segregation antitoxin (ccd killing protein)